MFRRLLAAFLLGLMTMVTATSRGRLCYCLCLNTITLGQCGCVGSGMCASGPDPIDASGDCGDCHCCEEEEAASLIEAKTARRHDCMIVLQLEVDDYCLSSEPVPVSRDDEFTGSPHAGERILLQHSSRSVAVRGPPDRCPVPDVPLYLRHLVFLV